MCHAHFSSPKMLTLNTKMSWNGKWGATAFDLINLVAYAAKVKTRLVNE
jgi:hypothetical protein